MLHVGVIGCGGMGRSHIDRLTNRTQGAEVVAVADMVDALVEKGAAIAGPNCKKYKSEADLINDPAVDAVFIVTPGFAHKEALLMAIKAGKRISARNRFARRLRIASKSSMQKSNPANT